MRFLLVHPFLSFYGGAQLEVSWIAKESLRQGHQVTLVSEFDKDGCIDSLTRAGVCVKLSEKARLSSLIQEEAQKSDAVVAFNYPATVWCAEAKKKSSSFPLLSWYCNEPPRNLYEAILSSHYLNSRVDPKFYLPFYAYFQAKKNRFFLEQDQQAVSCFDQVFSISHFISDCVRQIYHLDSEVMPLGVGDTAPEDQKEEEGSSVRENIHSLEKIFSFFSPAGLEPIKNFKTIFSAYYQFSKQMNKSGRKAQLWVTGEGLWLPEAKKMWKKMGEEVQILFLGRVEREKLKDLYSQCDAVLYVPIDEPFGLVNCEAGLFKKPVITSCYGGPSEVVIDQETGILVDPLNEREIAARMLFLAENPELCEKMGKTGFCRISSEFSFEKFMTSFLKGILSLFKKKE
jgi:glycosyltransferase involved in cell wall biosynthesis